MSNNFDENSIVRDAAGKFGEKGQSAPEASLPAPPDELVFGDPADRVLWRSQPADPALKNARPAYPRFSRDDELLEGTDIPVGVFRTHQQAGERLTDGMVEKAVDEFDEEIRDELGNDAHIEDITNWAVKNGIIDADDVRRMMNAAYKGGLTGNTATALVRDDEGNLIPERVIPDMVTRGLVLEAVTPWWYGAMSDDNPSIDADKHLYDAFADGSIEGGNVTWLLQEAHDAGLRTRAGLTPWPLEPNFDQPEHLPS